MGKKLEEIKPIETILNQDIEFIYNGKGAAFCPLEDIYVVGYDNEGKAYRKLDDAINAKVFDGKSLLEIWDEISPQFS